MNLKNAFNNKEVLITGGLGMIGSNLAHELVRLGAKVTIFDALLPMYGGNIFNLNGIRDKVKVEIADIRDKDKVNQIVQGKDYIFNFAAQVAYTYSMEEPFYDADINCTGHLNVLEACRKYNKKVKVIFSGSRMQYGKIDYNPVDEKHQLMPLSIYGVHKTTGEKYHLAYNHHYGIRATCFRIANPYGPRSQMKSSQYSIINWFIRQAMEDKPITIFGDGSQVRDYIYVGDIVEAMLKAAASDRTNGEVYNLGSGTGTKFIDMAKLVVKTVGKGRIEQVPWPKDWHNVETGDYWTDIRKLQNTIDWKPKTSLKEGIKKTYLYYKKHKGKYW